MLNGRDLLKPAELVVGGPLTRRNHDVAVRLSEGRADLFLSRAASVCRGRRQFGRPMMALNADKRLGPVRHALAQMVVAGTMVVEPPIQVRVPSGTGDHPVRPAGTVVDGGGVPLPTPGPV